MFHLSNQSKNQNITTTPTGVASSSRSIGSSVLDGFRIPSPPHFDNTPVYHAEEQSVNLEDSIITTSTKRLYHNMPLALY